jgi:murein DD-endopeptidase MepM/ murein hydrolase activator NlpD
LLNASVGVQRVLGRLRRPPSRPASPARGLRSRSHAIASRIDRGLHAALVRAHLVPGRTQSIAVEGEQPRRRRSLAGRIGHDRVLAVAVAGILVGASVISVTGGGRGGPTGGPTGDGPAPRIAVGGDVGQGADGDGSDASGDGQGSTNDGEGSTNDGQDATGDGQDSTGDVTGDVQFGEPGPGARAEPQFAAVAFGDEEIEPEVPVSVEGPFIDDGTLVKPVAVDTTVPDGSALVKSYTVKAGDTLAEIATRFHVSTMSVWWANDLKSKNDIKAGRVLRIPPVTGLIVRVAATDTLDGLAARYGVNSTDILATNGLDDPNLVVGQVLVVPGAKGKPIPPKPQVRPTSRPSSGSVRPPTTYRGGSFLWPVVGGGNYISQYFHYGHYGLDIAADYGTRVRAAAAGTVIFAGWKSNGGGYQVWIAHGSGLYTTYNHMSAVSVGRGQHVSRGQQVGRVGQSGYATGPHLHFEVWRGPVWDGGRRVNPLAYL